MLDKCILCGKIIKTHRSKHLRDEHRIDSRWKGAVREYFTDSRFDEDERLQEYRWKGYA